MALEVMQLLPSWLTEDYIADLLRKGQKSDLQIKIHDVTTASAPGDNYLGSVYRIIVECDSIHKSLIVKIMSIGDHDSSFISSYGVFGRELEIYHKVLPRLYGVMREKLGRVEYFSPYCYPSSRSDTIILEDLRPLGYEMLDRKKQLDVDHALPVLTVLAKIHAFSFVMGSENIRHYHDIFFSNEHRHLSEGLLTSIVKSLSRSVSKWRGYEKYAPLLFRFSESAVDQFNEAVSAKEGTFCVLNHGDCWTTNLLFRHCPDTGKILDLKLIDYQLGRYSSPVLDLMFFFYSSLRVDAWKQQDFLLRYYHGELTRWLSSAGVSDNVYTLQDLQKDMKEKLPYALAIISTVLAISLADSGEGPDIEKLFLETADTQVSEYHKAHNTERYRKNVQAFLPYLDQCGLFRPKP